MHSSSSQSLTALGQFLCEHQFLDISKVASALKLTESEVENCVSEVRAKSGGTSEQTTSEYFNGLIQFMRSLGHDNLVKLPGNVQVAVQSILEHKSFLLWCKSEFTELFAKYPFLSPIKLSRQLNLNESTLSLWRKNAIGKLEFVKETPDLSEMNTRISLPTRNGRSLTITIESVCNQCPTTETEDVKMESGTKESDNRLNTDTLINSPFVQSKRSRNNANVKKEFLRLKHEHANISHKRVAKLIGISTCSLNKWLRKAEMQPKPAVILEQVNQSEQVQILNTNNQWIAVALKDIIKKAPKRKATNFKPIPTKSMRQQSAQDIINKAPKRNATNFKPIRTKSMRQQSAQEYFRLRRRYPTLCHTKLAKLTGIGQSVFYRLWKRYPEMAKQSAFDDVIDDGESGPISVLTKANQWITVSQKELLKTKTKKCRKRSGSTFGTDKVVEDHQCQFPIDTPKKPRLERSLSTSLENNDSLLIGDDTFDDELGIEKENLDEMDESTKTDQSPSPFNTLQQSVKSSKRKTCPIKYASSFRQSIVQFMVNYPQLKFSCLAAETNSNARTLCQWKANDSLKYTKQTNDLVESDHESLISMPQADGTTKLISLKSLLQYNAQSRDRQNKTDTGMNTTNDMSPSIDPFESPTPKFIRPRQLIVEI